MDHPLPDDAPASVHWLDGAAFDPTPPTPFADLAALGAELTTTEPNPLRELARKIDEVFTEWEGQLNRWDAFTLMNVRELLDRLADAEADR